MNIIPIWGEKMKSKEVSYGGIGREYEETLERAEQIPKENKTFYFFLE